MITKRSIRELSRVAKVKQREAEGVFNHGVDWIRRLITDLRKSRNPEAADAE